MINIVNSVPASAGLLENKSYGTGTSVVVRASIPTFAQVYQTLVNQDRGTINDRAGRIAPHLVVRFAHGFLAQKVNIKVTEEVISQKGNNESG